MLWFALISIIVILVFFGMGWGSAQRVFTWSKLLVGVAVIGTPLTVIWWVLELIDWPTSLLRLLYPILVIWLPYISGNLLHQLIIFFTKKSDDTAA
jgi:hypothetical protein